jgi:hypothetical protein
MVAQIVAEPADTPIARPVVGRIVATIGVSELQVAAVVTFCVVPSEYVPVAVSCVVIPATTVAGLGVIAIDSNIAGVTVRVVFPDTDPDVAVITDEPTVNALASPELALTVAIVGVPEVQLTLLVKLAVLVSENVPIAVNCCVSPSGTLGALGPTAMETKPLTNDIFASLVVPDTRYEVSTSFGKSPTPGQSVTTSPTLNETAALAGVPLTKSCPAVTVTGVPAN